MNVVANILPALPALGAYPFCTNTSGGITQSPLAWGRNDTLYYGLSGYDNQDGGDTSHANNSVLLARSTDLGNAWSTALVDNTRGLTGQAVTHDAPVSSVAVDSSGPQDVVYVGWRQGYPNQPSSSTSSINGSVVAVSTDGGRSFAKPVNLNTFNSVPLDVNGMTYPLGMSSPFLAASSGGVVEAISGPSLLTKAKLSGPTPPEPMVGP